LDKAKNEDRCSHGTCRNKKKNGRRTEAAIRAYRASGTKTDPEGSYTGRPDAVFGKVPVQDADDL